MTRFMTLALLLTAAFSSLAAPVIGPRAPRRRPEDQNKVRVLTYNLQNLFDTVNDPNTLDDDFTPKGGQAWTEGVLRDKIANLGRIIVESNADVVGLVEIENPAMLERFQKEGLGGQYPHSAIANTQDPRGIRVALISKFPILESKSHPMNAGALKGHGTRDLLEASVRFPNGARVTFFVNHWPARSREPGREQQRTDAARILAQKSGEVLRANPQSIAVALGDFNDELSDRPFAAGMRLTKTVDELVQAGPAGFFALDSELLNLKPEQRGTHYFHPEKSWSTLDHMLMGAGPFAARNPESARIRYVAGSVKVYRHALVPSSGIPQGCELRGRGQSAPAGARTKCPQGSSDHLPVMADFELTR